MTLIPLHTIAQILRETLFGIILESELKFEKYINKTCNIDNKKLNVLQRPASHMSLEKGKMRLRAMIKSQFDYCPLVWMFYSRTLLK